jgi:hypothetical protein
MKTYLEYLAEAEALAEAKDTPADANKLDGTYVAGLKGAMSMPDISNNKSNGSAYLQYRFGIALAGAHSDKDKSQFTEPAGAFAGDPVMLTYADEEAEMIKNAADMVGGGRQIPIGDKHSIERTDTHKISPHRNPGPIKLKRK